MFRETGETEFRGHVIVKGLVKISTPAAWAALAAFQFLNPREIKLENISGLQENSQNQ